ncbi:ras-related protein Rab-34 [Sitophilus oryzae]|uniref:Ras-related protein Rab-36 n=1 Tax=Sitophilus oryzae TaxID=7048 RepID=A0A6J2X6T4_SITOR|nr:ras-related protein Rab-34 [Sitophilus oryzae]
MNDSVPRKQILNKYVQPYNIDCTPYTASNFSNKVQQYCLTQPNEINFAFDTLKMCKVIVIGDTCVGKTSLINRFTKKMFEANYKSTIGVDFEIEKFLILGVSYSLQIWDTAGQERFKSIAQSYYRAARVIVICFDLTNYESLLHSRQWLVEALNANRHTNPLVFLVGTKQDLLNDFSYKCILSDAFKLAKELKAEYWTVSSKSGKNINKLFSRIAVLSFDKLIKEQNDVKENVLQIGERLDGLGNSRCKKTKTHFLKNCCS